jgi:hypothetical protein
MIAVFPDVIDEDAASVLKMDGVCPRTVLGKSHCYKEDNDTQPHSGAF